MKLRQASNICKTVTEAGKLAYTNDTKSVLLPRNQALATFGELLMVFSTKVNLLFLLSIQIPRLVSFERSRWRFYEFALYFYKSAIRSCMEYCCNVWAGAPSVSWICWINDRNGYIGLLVLHLMVLLKHWVIVEWQPAQVLSIDIN